MTNSDLARQITDQSIGEKVRTFRKAAALSQNQVAASMRHRGFTWYGTTVSRTESGERPLKAAEVTSLCISLGANPSELILGDTSAADGNYLAGYSLGVKHGLRSAVNLVTREIERSAS